jgi:phenylpropionate dioxygenase-like ring-hydroxylating dioxygenase large terminal subunit
MQHTPGFERTDYVLPQIRCEQWMGWIYITLNPEAESVSERLSDLKDMIAHFHVENYTETFHETHVWDTNWKVLAENFMESYHLQVCHAETVGPHSSIKDMDCPPGKANFNYHWITKEASLAICNVHPDNDRLTGPWRKTTALISIYPSHFITLTPGYFWYLSLHPHGVGQVHITYGGGLSPDFMADPKATEYQHTLKTMLDEVNVEDRGCTERVYCGLNAPTATPGNLSYLERPNYDFARYLARRLAGE